MSPIDYIEAIVRPGWRQLSDADFARLEAIEATELRKFDAEQINLCCAHLQDVFNCTDKKKLAVVYQLTKRTLFEEAQSPKQHPTLSPQGNEVLKLIFLKNIRSKLDSMAFWFFLNSGENGQLPDYGTDLAVAATKRHEAIDRYGLDHPIEQSTPQTLSSSLLELTVEIHFHEQEKASLYLESNCSGDHEKFGEIALLVFCALRMMSNLDVCEPSDGLARIMMAPASIPGASPAQMTENLQLIPYPGYPGRKRFVFKLRMSDQGCKFDLDFSGFDTEGGSDFGYYGPSAVIALMKHLSQRRIADTEFQQYLMKAAETCGAVQLKRQISLTNQIPLGVGVIDGCRRRYATGIREQFFRDAITQAGGSYRTEVPKSGCLLFVAAGLTLATALGFWLV